MQYLNFNFDYFFINFGTIFSGIDYFTFFLSIFIIIFANKIIPNQINFRIDYKIKIKIIRLISFFLIITYLLNLFLGFKSIANISETFLTFMFSFILYNWISFFVVSKYGDNNDNSNFKINNYVTQIINLSFLFFLILLSFVQILKIWEINSAFETTSVFGVIALLIFSTKDYWVDSVISAFILLTNGNIPRGSLIKIPSDNILGIVESISFSHTKIRDLLTSKIIYIPTYHLRTEKYEILANDSITSIKDFIDFNIGYDTDYSLIVNYFDRIFEQLKNNNDSKLGIDFDYGYTLRNFNNADHAVIWRLFFKLKQPRNILKARDAINKLAYINQDNFIKLSTPITHKKIN